MWDLKCKSYKTTQNVCSNQTIKLLHCRYGRLEANYPDCFKFNTNCHSSIVQQKEPKIAKITLFLTMKFSFKANWDKYSLRERYTPERYTTRNQLRVAIECHKGVKVKVVKWCWKKWNGPILMHIYAKQCEIMQKNQWKGSNGQIHCFCKGKSAPRC